MGDSSGSQRVGTLVLLRHGESEYNAAQVFTGLLDVDLTEAGAEQVKEAARLLKEEGIHPTLLVTSPMRRAARTAALLFGHLGYRPDVMSCWRLVERDYGCLTGVSKAEARQRHGEENFFNWRRTVHGCPPEAPAEQRASWVNPAPVADSGSVTPGRGESLADVIERVRCMWTDILLPRMRAGETVLVASHGNTLRALVTIMLSLNDEEASQLNIPAGHPLVFTLPVDGMLGRGRYLDMEAAAKATAAVAAEGGT